jgi:putative solute:sodium symporter small subunit
MKLTRRHRAYWRINLILTASLLAVWFLITFVTGYFARELNEYSFLGFPLSFYIFSQGALIVFLIIIGIYVWVMNRLDRRFGVAERR